MRCCCVDDDDDCGVLLVPTFISDNAMYSIYSSSRDNQPFFAYIQKVHEVNEIQVV